MNAANRANFTPAAMQELNLASASMHNEYLNRELEVALARDWLDNGNMTSRNRLVNAHMRLASKMAKSMVNCNISMNDLIQEASMGLMKAADKYDPDTGWRFATYARWWIKAALQETAMRDGSSVRLKSSSTNRTAFFSLSKIEDRAEANLRKSGDVVSPEDILTETARLMGITRDKLIDVKASLPSVHSLNEVVAKNGHEMSEKIELLESGDASPEELVIEESNQAFLTNLISEAMGALTERERIIIEKRSMSLDPLTLDELSGEFGVTRERVRQIEVGAKEKMRKRLAGLGIKNTNFLGSY
ncbi:sigma-70 family RNA polymerase sigma factor [Pseudosulfitobacter pseudonitzschiae]|uniref:sigma-70 family RNA polymerase sigma factor n=1 Tax=Pseudosulfitobacter pseudonitzschiae TaxID=1402135 RepID=UPI003B7A8C8F